MPDQITSSVVGRMGDRAQGRSRTPDVPDEWEHVPAPNKPKKPPEVRPFNWSRSLAEYQRYLDRDAAWLEFDTEARLEQWASKEGDG